MGHQPAWQETLTFFPPAPIVVEPSHGQLSGDAGLLPIRQFDERIGLTRAFAQALDDPRDPALTEHPFLEMVRSRVYGILAGYEDQNDHDTLRADPVFKLVADRSPEDDDLASQPTLSRFENAISITSLKRLRGVFLDQFIASFDIPPRHLTFDLDAVDDPAHGQQPLPEPPHVFEQELEALGTQRQVLALPAQPLAGDGVLGRLSAATAGPDTLAWRWVVAHGSILHRVPVPIQLVCDPGQPLVLVRPDLTVQRARRECLLPAVFVPDHEARPRPGEQDGDDALFGDHDVSPRSGRGRLAPPLSVRQSSSGIITVMTGSPWSPGPQTALSRTSGGKLSSLVLRTRTAKWITGPSAPRRTAQRRSQSMSHNLPDSSWHSTPSGTVTHFAQTAAVTATGKRMPASRAISVTLIW
jgi:Transposase DDE domain group 1